jgi:hypothetical protein
MIRWRTIRSLLPIRSRNQDRKRFPTRQLNSENDPYPYVAVTDPEPISKPDTDPESRPEPNPEDENAFRHKDIFYMKKEERKKMTDFVYKKDSWLADYYLEENFWKFLKIFIFIAFE